jgi:indole-3-glycerol phosphate synthase
MRSILDRITEQTQNDLRKRMREVSIMELESFPHYERETLSLSEALRGTGLVGIIAEIKKASPSKGVIRNDFDPKRHTEQYIGGGAAAISVLTDEPFFQGSLGYLSDAASISTVPLLRKDFILDPYQVKEAKAYGADAVLLIAEICSGSQMEELLAATHEFGLQALVECYSEHEFEQLPWKKIEIVGVNNRNLNTFEVDLHRGVSLLNQAPEHVVTVSESGLHKPDDLCYLYDHGVDAALIGEYFMRQNDPGRAIEEMSSLLNQRSGSEPEQ